MSRSQNRLNRSAFVSFITEVRTDEEIERVIGYEKRSVARVSNMLIRKGINIQSEANPVSGRRYWLAHDLESALAIVNPEKKAPGKKEGLTDNKENQCIWFIITPERRGSYHRIEEMREEEYAKTMR